MKKTLSLLFVLVVLVAVTPAAFGQFTNPATTNITVTVAAEAALSVAATTPLTTGTALFDNYTGSTAFTYKVRTTQSTGSGTITAQVTADFSPVGGPSVATSGATGNTLSYGCTVSAPGSGCSTSQTASTSASTGIATFGANARSAKAGNSGSLAWVLVNDPQYQTGSYQATVMLSMSAL